MGGVYDHLFDQLAERSAASARVVVPMVIDLLNPSSVVDVGCGLGTWLAIVAESGVEDYVGIDGDYVSTRQDLRIPRDRFVAADLAAAFSFDRRFDLAISLEVAEHLPPESASTFVAGLVKLAPAVLFSAAVPGQSGIHHVNLQWPEYWGTLFANHGFRPTDPIRPRIWLDERVEWWYRQNIVLYLNSDLHGRFDDGRECDALRPVIHPEMHREVVDGLMGRRLALSELARAVPSAVRRSVVHRLHRASRS